MLDISKTDRALDLATGTADVAILQGKRGATVLGVDPSQNMLDIGRGKVTEAGLDDVVKLELGDATSLTAQFLDLRQDHDQLWDSEHPRH